MLQSKPTVTVKPKNLKQTPNTTKIEVLKNIDPIKEDLVLQQVRDISNGGLADIRFESSGNISELLNLKMINSCFVKVLNPVSPRIRMSEKLDNITSIEHAEISKQIYF